MKDFITRQVKEVGLGIAAFCLMSWMVVTITNDLSGNLKTLSSSMKEFTARVGFEHQTAIQQRQRMIEAQKGIAETLGRINGYTH